MTSDTLHILIFKYIGIQLKGILIIGKDTWTQHTEKGGGTTQKDQLEIN